MDAQLKAKWVEALRSGKYGQLTGQLRDKSRFCCLGVLCDTMDAEWLHDGDAIVDGELESFYLGPIALHSSGLTDSQQEILYNMNDDGKSFAEIADYIEANL